MDRHQGEGLTRQQIAEQHVADVKIQAKYNCNFITYWYDEERDAVFCLVDAPNMGAVRKVHDEAHGSVHSQIIEVDPDLVKAFLGRADHPSDRADDLTVDSAFRAVMFTDLAGSTRMIRELGDEGSMGVLRRHNALTRDALRAHSGREIKHTGDGFMASFVSALSAVECAIAIQESMWRYNEINPEQKMFVRIGISAGEPVHNDNQLYGASVNLAARLCENAKPGSILVAPVIRELAVGKKIPFVERGEFKPKGFDQPILTYEVSWMGA
jgi:class 3 adenylate cyclase